MKRLCYSSVGPWLVEIIHRPELERPYVLSVRNGSLIESSDGYETEVRAREKFERKVTDLHEKYNRRFVPPKQHTVVGIMANGEVFAEKVDAMDQRNAMIAVARSRAFVGASILGALETSADFIPASVDGGMVAVEDLK